MIEDVVERAFAATAGAVADGRIPGATLGIVAADGRSAVRLAGMAALLPESEALTEDHRFDLASLSKVVAATSVTGPCSPTGSTRPGIARPASSSFAAPPAMR